MHRCVASSRRAILHGPFRLGQTPARAVRSTLLLPPALRSILTIAAVHRGAPSTPSSDVEEVRDAMHYLVAQLRGGRDTKTIEEVIVELGRYENGQALVILRQMRSLHLVELVTIAMPCLRIIDRPGAQEGFFCCLLRVLEHTRGFCNDSVLDAIHRSGPVFVAHVQQTKYIVHMFSLLSTLGYLGAGKKTVDDRVVAAVCKRLLNMLSGEASARARCSFTNQNLASLSSTHNVRYSFDALVTLRVGHSNLLRSLEQYLLTAEVDPLETLQSCFSVLLTYAILGMELKQLAHRTIGTVVEQHDDIYSRLGFTWLRRASWALTAHGHVPKGRFLTLSLAAWKLVLCSHRPLLSEHLLMAEQFFHHVRPPPGTLGHELAGLVRSAAAKVMSQRGASALMDFKQRHPAVLVQQFTQHLHVHVCAVVSTPGSGQDIHLLGNINRHHGDEEKANAAKCLLPWPTDVDLDTATFWKAHQLRGTPVAVLLADIENVQRDRFSGQLLGSLGRKKALLQSLGWSVVVIETTALNRADFADVCLSSILAACNI